MYIKHAKKIFVFLCKTELGSQLIINYKWTVTQGMASGLRGTALLCEPVPSVAVPTAHPLSADSTGPAL